MRLIAVHQEPTLSGVDRGELTVHRQPFQTRRQRQGEIAGALYRNVAGQHEGPRLVHGAADEEFARPLRVVLQHGL
jgi:hypothetical protein